MTVPSRTRRIVVPALAAALAIAATVAVVAQLGGSDQKATAATGLPYQNPALSPADRLADLLPRMSLDDKVGQMVQAERAAISASDVTTYRYGSILSGGGSAPSPNTPTGWSDMYDTFQKAALATPLGIPMIYGLDAVHGNNNVPGSTIFPHNIGLGATRDPALVQQVGRATAEEVTGAGLDWTFAPCLCVARDDRWGRTYESYGETPDLVSSMTTVVTGLQGDTLGGNASVLATAKHYLGDGGTTNGVDQGNTQLSEADLRAIHLPGFQAAIARNVGSIMVSFSSWNGTKMSANKYLLTDVLKTELGFKGFLVSDWAAIDQLDGQTGFTAQEIATAVNAGLDMLMVPNSPSTFLSYLKQDVQNGQIAQSRIDDAVSRILLKKFELGLFEHPLADRSYAGTIGNSAHRATARQAVRESQVLLKNSNNILPLTKSGGKIFVAGKNADDIGNQSGGWTVSWQGASGNTYSGGTTILQGIRNAVGSGATVTYSKDGTGIDSSYRAAVAVIGETPYAEGQGDRPNGVTLDAADLAVLAKLKAAGVPVVTVLVSGRPVDVSAQLPDMAALLASWLPGSEGAGVADVLFGDYAPTGKLPVTWPQSYSQEPINDGDGKAALFPYGFGLSYPGGGNPSPSPSVSPSRSVSPSPSVSPVRSASPSVSPSVSPTRSATPSANGGMRCTVTYKVTSQWQGGFQGDVTVAVTGGTVNGWSLAFTFGAGQQITQAWNTTISQSGAAVTARDVSWNSQLGTAQFGFIASWTGSNPVPAAFTLNGTACGTS
jgi:beta-glucosidase